MIAWLLLALVHGVPAAVAVRPPLITALYGVSPEGDVGLLLAHRGVGFMALTAVAGLAAFDHRARRPASLVVAISVVGFVTLYASAGFPAGPLRTIAAIDVLTLVPLGLATYTAWRPT